MKAIFFSWFTELFDIVDSTEVLIYEIDSSILSSDTLISYTDSVSIDFEWIYTDSVINIINTFSFDSTQLYDIDTIISFADSLSVTPTLYFRSRLAYA